MIIIILERRKKCYHKSFDHEFIYLFIFFSFIPSYYVYDNHDHRRWLIFCNVFFFLWKMKEENAYAAEPVHSCYIFYKSNHILKKNHRLFSFTKSSISFWPVVRERENKNFENGTFNFIWNFLFLFCRTKNLQLVISSFSRFVVVVVVLVVVIIYESMTFCCSFRFIKIINSIDFVMKNLFSLHEFDDLKKAKMNFENEKNTCCNVLRCFVFCFYNKNRLHHHRFNSLMMTMMLTVFFAAIISFF